MPDALARLPIPARLLVALVLVLAALMLPHLANLGPGILAFFCLAALWRLLAVTRPGWLPGRWTLLMLMVIAVALVITTTGLQDGRLAGTALLAVMLGLKLLELRARRDIHVTVFLGYFLVLTQFLYNQSLWLAGYLLVGVLALVALQVGLNRVTVDLRVQLRDTAAMLGAALPVALVVFLLFPRLQTPLWGINTQSAVTGISGDLTLGDIGRLSRSNATAFRVRFDDRVPEPAERYWRGPVLWETDGARWQAGRRALQLAEPPVGPGDRLDYEITLEPTGEYWLFGLDVVTAPPPEAQINSNHALVGIQRVNRRMSYRAGSDPDYRIARISARERRLGLQLPERVSARVRALVDGWQRETDPAQPLELVGRALAHFRNEPFVYTLAPGVLEGDVVDRFLFETRRGFCEHYAGSFALLMRLAGVPSRVVLGYQGGERNPHADHWVVRQSDAHAWTEVWIEGLGWWRVDPTAAVAPQRIEQPIDPARSGDSGEIVFQVDARGVIGSLWSEAAWLVDAVDLGWHRWIVGFSAERQRGLFERFGVSQLHGVALGFALLLGVGMALGLVYLLSRLPRPRRRDDLAALWQRLRGKLQRAGMATPGWLGPDTLCADAARHYPDQAAELTAIGRLYVQLRYGRGHDRRQIDALRRRIGRLRLRRLRRA
jgi:transglutaminase-like putative cysteine protease